MIDSISPEKDDLIIEIGPGDGAVTKELLKTEAQIISVEIDYDLLPRLITSFGKNNNFKLIHEDILKVKLAEQINENTKSIKIIGSLPYNISKQIIDKILKANSTELKDSRAKISLAVFIVQDEVAKIYSAKAPKATFLSNYAGLFADVKKLESIPASQFYPRPKVNGGILLFNLFLEPVKNSYEISRFLKKIFISPRKTLANNLKNLGQAQFSAENLQLVFTKLNLSATARASELLPETVLALYNYLYPNLEEEKSE